MKKPFDYNLAHDTRFKMWTMFLSEPLKATCQVCTKKIGIAEPFYFCQDYEEFYCSIECDAERDKKIHDSKFGHIHTCVKSVEVRER